jgi:hypothetical protein
VLPGVTVEAASPALIDKLRSVVRRRHGPVPHRWFAPRHLLGFVHAAGLQHGAAGRHRADRHLRGDRRNNSELRIAKIFRYGRTRSQVGFDIYNALNNDVATSQTETFSTTTTAWLRPTAIIPARYVRISAQFDF